MANAEDQAEINNTMQILEASPDSSTPSAVPLVSSNDTPADRERLAVLVSTGKSKEAIGVQLTHNHVKHLSDKYVENTSKGMKPTQVTRLLSH